MKRSRLGAGYVIHAFVGQGVTKVGLSVGYNLKSVNELPEESGHVEMVHLIRVIGDTSSRKQPGKYGIMPCCGNMGSLGDAYLINLVSSKRQEAKGRNRTGSDGPEQDNLFAYL